MGVKMHKCEADVLRGGGQIRDVGYVSGCNRRGTIEVGGKWYCWQHNPIEVERRRKESEERAEMKWRSDMRAKQKCLELLRGGK